LQMYLSARGLGWMMQAGGGGSRTLQQAATRAVGGRERQVDATLLEIRRWWSSFGMGRMTAVGAFASALSCSLSLLLLPPAVCLVQYAPKPAARALPRPCSCTRKLQAIRRAAAAPLRYRHSSMAAALSMQPWLICGGPSSLSSDMCFTGTPERADGAVGSAGTLVQPGPLQIWSRRNCSRGVPSGSMRSSATAAQLSIVTGRGGIGGATMLRWGTAHEEGVQIASATESASKSHMRLPCMHSRPATSP
jgi:hypothetical protein